MRGHRLSISSCTIATVFLPLVLALTFTSFVFQIPTKAQANVQGQWQTLPYMMPINPIHAALLSSGKVLIVAGSGNYSPDTSYEAAVWDPSAGSISTQPVSWDMFCNGMIVLPDGRVLVMGGTIQYDPFFGQMRTSAYDPATGNFVDMQSMAHGRWYPTPTVLSDGSLMVFSGFNETGGTNQAVEIYKVGSGWSQEYIAPWTPPLYPRMHLLPNGTVFNSGPNPNSNIFNPSTQTWQTNVAWTNYAANRTYGSSVLLPLTPANNYKPRVFLLGGGSPATKSTEVIDLSASPPVWVWGPSMTQPRIEMNATLLPNGTVLAVGGSTNDEDLSTASLSADLFNVNSTTITVSSAGSNSFPRLYHSIELLLPDATVMVAGGNPARGSYEPHIEIYSPPYLFSPNGTLATRPTISSVSPGTVGYGATFQVSSPNAGSISSVVLMRAGSVTHAFDMDQRMVGLNYTVQGNTLTVTAPPNGNIAPPGYYMLFLLNSSGVPSKASFLQLSLAPSDIPPTGIITSPAADATTFAHQQVSFAGSGTDPDGTITGYSWVFPGGSPANSNSQAPGNVTFSVAGTYTPSLTVTDNSGLTDPSPKTRTITVVPAFSLSASPNSQTVAVGGSGNYNVAMTPDPGFTGTVSFAVSGLPSGATASFSPASTSSGSVTLGISLSAATPTGNYTLKISGTGGGCTETTAATLAVVTVTSTTNYVTAANFGTIRNNYTGWVGMKIAIGSSPVVVTELGRVVAGTSTGTHVVKIVQASNGTDLPGASALINVAGGTQGAFVYTSLGSPVTLNANTSYYVITQETQGGDQWYDYNTAVQTTSVATVSSAVYNSGSSYIAPGSIGQTYGPVDFVYAVSGGGGGGPPVISQQPQNTTVAASQTATFSVSASGSGISYQWQIEGPGAGSFSNIAGATGSSYTTAATQLSDNGTEFHCVVNNNNGSVTSSAATLTVTGQVSGGAFVSSETFGILRNNYTGWVGMTIRVGASPITVTALGRMVAGTSAATHVVKIVQASNGTDLAGASATVNVAGGPPNTFVYASLASAVTLNANTSYYVITQETFGGDQWYDYNGTIVQTASVATVTSSVYGTGSPYVTTGSTGQTYGPVDFLYGAASGPPSITQQPQSTTVTAGQTATFSVSASGAASYQWQIEAPGAGSFSNIGGATGSSYTTGATQLSDSGTQFQCVVSNNNGSVTSSAATLTVTAQASGTAFVISKTVGTLRNNYTGWVGMTITIRSSPVTVTALGRMVAGTSTATHVVKIVQASNGADVPGASVTVNVAGGAAGSFVYGTLASPVTLSANTSYYVVTQETFGGDQWGDYNDTTVQGSSVAMVSSAVYGTGASYTAPGSIGQTYGPVDFLYQ